MKIGGIARFALGASLAALLSSCAAYQQYEQQEAPAQAAALTAQADSICRGYGATPGTPAYIQCRMNVDNQRIADDRMRRAIATQYLLSR